jgi:hypothetical protein
LKKSIRASKLLQSAPMSKEMTEWGDFDETTKETHAARKENMTTYEWDYTEF